MPGESYEHNTDEGRRRMDRLGYIRGLPEVVEGIPDLRLEPCARIEAMDDPLNPTHVYVIRKTGTRSSGPSGLWCPLSRGPLEDRTGYLYSPQSLLAYPVVEGIPILRIEKGHQCIGP